MPEMMERIERLRALMQERGYDAVVLRNNPDLRWLTGIARVFDDEVAHTVVVTADKLLLHTDSRYYGSFVERMGEDSPWVVDEEIVSHAAWCAARLRELRARVVAIEDTLTLGFYESLVSELGKISAACLMPRLHGDLSLVRMTKDAEELSLLRRAQEITDKSFDHICSFIQPGMTELAIRAELEASMLGLGAHGLSFETIIASGPNGANPHARPSERVVETGDLIVMDYGALFNDYHADMTRTVSVGGPSDEQRAVYDVVRKAHETCAEAARPGMCGRELHELAVQVISEAGYGAYFNHGLGHGVGVEIHERPHVGRRSEDSIPVGGVFTIEPGIYLPGRFGIRLEDTGVMGEQGFESFASSTHELVVVGR
ncbi:MAG: Xaa-Pro peptidase family protein [Coriobacteriales bacterium]|nr:Xaa-Pro peptidase family protein [Coriobacteriales bacterium]